MHIEMTTIAGADFPVDAAKLLIDSGYQATAQPHYWYDGKYTYYITFLWNTAYSAYVIKAEKVE